MYELPESLNIARQLNDTIVGKSITGVIAAFTPHKLAWYFGKPPEYPGLLTGKTIGSGGNQSRRRGYFIRGGDQHQIS
jgi:formamidopyrimidine-DNA glycosylase